MSDDKFNKIMLILGFSIMVLVLIAFIVVALFEEYEYCNCIKRCETCGKVVKE
jgi:hypothetical protein